MHGPQPWDLKLARADQHLQELTSEIATYRASGAFEVIEEHEGDDLVVRAVVHEQPPARWSTIIGDVLHNARSALDSLAFRLAELSQQRPLTDKEAQKVDFPAYSSPMAFDDRLDRDGRRNGKHKGLMLLSPDCLAMIRASQPFAVFEAAGDKLATEGDYTQICSRMPLARLEHLSNIDKHRRVHVLLLDLSMVSYASQGAERGDSDLQWIPGQAPSPAGWEICRLRRPGGPAPQTLGTTTELSVVIGDGSTRSGFDFARPATVELREILTASAGAIQRIIWGLQQLRRGD